MVFNLVGLLLTSFWYTTINNAQYIGIPIISKKRFVLNTKLINKLFSFFHSLSITLSLCSIANKWRICSLDCKMCLHVNQWLGKRDSIMRWWLVCQLGNFFIFFLFEISFYFKLCRRIKYSIEKLLDRRMKKRWNLSNNQSIQLNTDLFFFITLLYSAINS